MFIGFRGDGQATGNLITNNWFDRIGNFDFGYAVSLRGSYYADVTDNKMTSVWTGVHLSNFGLAGPATWTISHNDISSYAGGILYWLAYNSSTGVTIDGNTVAAAPGAVANNFGVMFDSVQSSVKPTFTNNTITGADYGIGIFDVPTTNTLTLGATNAVVNAKLGGVLFTNNLNFNPVGTTNFLAGGPGAASTVILNGMPISSIAGGAGVIVDATGGTTTTLSITGTPSITGGSTGVRLVGASAKLSGNTLGAASFAGQSGQYVELTNGAENGLVIDGTGVTFDGVTGATASSAQAFNIEDKITHAIDQSGLALSA